MVAGLAQRGDGEKLGGLAGGGREGGDAALERRDALLEDVGRRVRDAGVDVTELCEAEEAGAVLGVIEDVGRGLVDRHGAGVGRRVGLLSGVKLEGFKVVVFGVVGHVVLPLFVLA